ncbi:Ppx/GppA family phosphatase [Streptomyces sp. M19]
MAIAERQGAIPLPVHTAKRQLRLAAHVERDGRLPGPALDWLARSVSDAVEEARDWGEGAVRLRHLRRTGRPNRSQALRAVEKRSGLALRVLSGHAEAELTFLAARRWMGWGPVRWPCSTSAAGPRSGLRPRRVAGLRARAAAGRRAAHAGALRRAGPAVARPDQGRTPPRTPPVAGRLLADPLGGPHTTAATSRTFQQLARLCGAAPGRHGPFVPRTLTRTDLAEAVRQLRRLTAAERARLPGISARGPASRSPGPSSRTRPCSS